MAPPNGDAAAGLTNVRRAIDALVFLGQARKPHHLRELAAQIGTSKSTMQRILATLEATQMVRLDDESGGYQLGPAIISLHANYIAAQDSMLAVRDEMDVLRQKTGETVMLSLMYGTERLVILRVESHHSLRYVRPVGGNYPLHTGATGKVLLGTLNDEDLDDTLQKLDLRREAPNTITDRKRLREEVLKARQAGWAVSREEGVLGVAGCAVPVYVPGIGKAALGVYGPLIRFGDAEVDDYVPLLLQSANQIELIT